MKTDKSNRRVTDLARAIDHTHLKPEATEKEIRKLVEEALEFGFYSVCVEAKWLPVVVPAVQGSTVLPITVIGFPGGSVSTAQKVRETEHAIEMGAKEIDMVLNREWLKRRAYDEVQGDIERVTSTAREIPVKVILETSELTREEKVSACVISQLAGAKFVKTSTGFSSGGASVEDVALMRAVVADGIGVKASGGIRDLKTALAMLDAGANRLGMSASVAVLKELVER